MDVVGSEIGQKMRSAIKAKLTELGCYVDDELPDYVMVMVANKRTRAQMEDDLQLFLGDNTELFVNWLHQVLKKLQEVTVPTVPNPEPEKIKENTKEKKSKQKKDKDKSKSKKKIDSLKKAKKKDKLKEKIRKKEEKKAHKSKKKSKHHEMIRPNVPPLLMNMEKVSEPSITDIFAGQILKNHGIIIEAPQEEKPEQKPVVADLKRPILPIIDPATITQPEVVEVVTSTSSIAIDTEENTNSSTAAPREEQISEITEIEAKIQGLKQKLAEQLDSMSDDEDFLNIRTEAEELMNDFAEDVFQEISSQAPPVETPPITSKKTSPAPIISEPSEISLDAPIPPEDPPKDPPKAPEPEVLPQIELNLPKRPVRERLGARQEKKMVEEPATKEKEESAKERKRTESPERFTPDREPDFWGNYKSSAKSRLGEPNQPCRKSPVTAKRSSFSDDSDESGAPSKRERRVSSSSSERPRVCASVVRVRPRARVAPSTSLLMRAVADAHKSLLNIPPKPEVEPHKIKRALVHPMRRCVDAQNILIQVPTDRHLGDDELRNKLDMSREEYIPVPLSKKFTNTDYVPSRRPDRSSSRKDDTLIIETLNIHNPTVDKDKKTQFIVTMDGFDPNAFLAKKLKTEGLFDEEDALLELKSKKQPKTVQTVQKTAEVTTKTVDSDKEIEKEDEIGNDKTQEEEEDKDKTQQIETEAEIIDDTKQDTPKKRLSDTSDESDTQVILQPVDENIDERKQTEPTADSIQDSSQAKKRKASPIVFDVQKAKEDAERKRQRTESTGSDNHVIVTTPTNPHKYEALPPHLKEIPQVKVPPISQPEKKSVWCRSFPLCRYGASCVFQHPRCKFAAACTRRGCPYSHAGAALPAAPTVEPPTVASHVVPVANYKMISGALPSVCKYYPNCVNPGCHFHHPKPCRYGKACANKLECNFYHSDFPAKFRYPV